MGTLSITQAAHGARHARALLWLIVALVGSTTFLHHAGLAEAATGHGGMGGMDMGHAAPMAMCLGVIAGAVAIEGLVLIRRAARRRTPTARPRPVRRLTPPRTLVPATWRPPPRDGPALHLQLCVVRR